MSVLKGLAAGAAKVSLRSCVALLSLIVVNGALAQTTSVSIPQEYSKLIKSAEAVGALGSDLFGEQTNFYTGATSFNATDVSLPGNDSLAVAIGRSYEVGYRGDTTLQSLGLFADWELDVPHLSGVFAASTGWAVGTNTPTKRCSVSADQIAPPHIYINSGGSNTGIDPEEYWNGNSLHLPGGGGGLMLSNWRPTTSLPPSPGSYYWTTASNWLFSCLTKTANVSPTVPGEAFLGIAPDGTQYRFDWVATRPEPALAKARDSAGTGTRVGSPQGASYKQQPEPEPTIAASGGVTMSRVQVHFLPTLITDRFGNWVKYTWDPANPRRLKAIDGKDGRRITLAYNASGYISSVSDGTRTWTYTYNNGSLTTVKLPDNSAWTIDFSWLKVMTHPSQTPGPCMEAAANFLGGDGNGLPGIITHPSGARGQFGFKTLTTGRSYVPKRCTNPQTGYIVIPSKSNGVALYSKIITGPGIATETWTHDYGTPNNSFASDCATPTSCPTTRTVSVTGPGEFTRYTFGNKYQDTEGKLLKVERGANAGQILSIETTTYQMDPAGQGYPASIGYNPNDRLDINLVKYTPVIQRKLDQDGVTFTYTASSFNAFAEPQKETRSNTGSAGGAASRSQTLVYFQDLKRWVLNRVASVKDNATNKVVSQVDFDSVTSQPLRSYSFGVLQQSYTFNTDGTLASVKDGLNHATSYGSWFRGVPRLVTYASGASESAVVNDIGTIASSTDEMGFRTAYAYDAMGRLSGVTYPTGITPAWTPTTRSFAPVGAIEYGIPVGHWKQVVQTGNARTSTFYDAQWRPVLALTEDLGTGSTSFVVKRYDAGGREVFSAYPVASLSNVNDSTLKGVSTSYDGLGRVVQTSQHSELGALLTKTEYLSGFQTRVTNALGFATTTAYQVFDKPATDSPVRITLPEGVTTVISRDGFGKALAITRSGGTGLNAVSETRNYVYDASERLCKTVNPESGATLVDYDAAGNIAWDADGLALTSLACDRASVLAGEKTVRGYDAMNRPTSVATPGAAADITTSYFADGAVESVSAANPDGGVVTTAYDYNNRRMLTSETQTNGVVQYALAYGYNANGHLSSLLYPDLELVTYAPDALGRPTQVVGTSATYASDIRYLPNGAMSGFKYGALAGAGPVHTLTQNARLLPARSQDMLGAAPILDDAYSYDANGNVIEIHDRAQNFIRGMAYDGLDRLTTALADNLATPAVNDALWGVGTYSYDALDNLRSLDQGPNQFRYNYDASWRLATIRDPGGATLHTFAHDAQGNTIAKNGQDFVFDASNRMTSAEVLSGVGVQAYRYDGLGRRVQTTDPNGDTTFWLYSQAGQVLYTSEARRSRNLSYIYLNGSQIATRAAAWAPVNTVTVRYQMTDALGSPVADTDTSGGDVQRTSYTPWGEASPSRDGAGYTGHVMDADTGLTYMQQRYYDPQTGRFDSSDPAEPTSSGRMFNRFNYASNNPLSSKDPDGRCPTSEPCWEAPAPNFFRDSFVGRAVSTLVGDPIALFQKDGINPLSGAGLDPGELRNARENLVVTVATFGLGGIEASGAKSLSLATRTEQVHKVLDPIAQRMRTTAGLETQTGERLFGSGSRDLTPAQRKSLGAGESAAKLPKTHAEITVLNAAEQQGWVPRALEATREFCPACASAIEASGGIIESATRAVWH